MLSSRPKPDPTIEALRERVDGLQSAQWLHQRRLEDIHALTVLQPLTVGWPLLPLTGSALRPHCLLHIFNDILVNGRRRIIEFGTGISTLLIARLIRQNALNATVLSIDHDKHWVRIAADLLRAEKLGDIVTTTWAPLEESNLALEGNRWYSAQVVADAVGPGPYDMVLIDGPPAWQPGTGKSRFPALPFMLERLALHASIYLDDANRPGERSVMRSWTHHYNIPFQVTGETLGFAYLGDAFYSEPLTRLEI